MQPRIALIDYKAGNLTSVRKALAAVGAEFYTPEQPAELEDAQGIIVPGVGHFAATAALDAAWTDAILARVGEGRPLLGICLGLQWLFEGSTEAPACEGLSLMTGQCERLEGTWPLKVPHVGWNALAFPRASRLFEGVREGSQVYFTQLTVCVLHSGTHTFLQQTRSGVLQQTCLDSPGHHTQRQQQGS